MTVTELIAIAAAARMGVQEAVFSEYGPERVRRSGAGEQGVEYSGGDRNERDVVGERPEQVLPDYAHRGAAQRDEG